MTLNPVNDIPGSVITVTSTAWVGHNPGESCVITANNPALLTSASCIAGGAPGLAQVFGSFTVGSVGVPGGALYTVFVTMGSGAGAEISAGAAFTVDAGISLSPIFGPPTIHVTILGGGFETTGNCVISSGPPGLIAAGSDVCSVSGTAKTITAGSGFDVDAAAGPGLYTVTVTRAGPPVEAPTASFTVTVGPSVVAAPSSGPRGLSVSVSGSGFSLSDTSVTMGYTALGPGGALWTGTITPSLATAGPFKTASATFPVAATATVGITYRITIVGSTGDTGDTSAAGDFLVLADPVIFLAPGAGTAGTPVAVSTVTPFAVTDVGPCTMSSSPSTKLIPTGSGYVCQIDPFGVLVFGSQFIVPSDAPGGNYLVTVRGSQGDSASLNFVVQPAVTFDKLSGYPPITAPATPATEVTVTGTGFSSADNTCTITSGGPSLGIDFVSCTVSSSTGQLTARFKVKANSWWTGAGVAVTVTGQPGGDFPPAVLFTVDSRIVLSPTSGSAATTVNYAGSGLTNTPNPGGVCLVTPDITGIPVDPLTTTCFQDGFGNVFGQFKVPSPAPVPGVYLVTYTDAGGAAPTASAAFTVLGGPLVTLSTYSGPTGIQVTVTGSGFNPGDTSVQITTVGPPPELFLPTPVTCSVSLGNIASGCTFTVRSNAEGLAPPGYLLQITGNLGDFAQANFLVTATLNLSAIDGGINTLVQISGSGYLAGMGDCVLAGVLQDIPPAALWGISAVCDVGVNGILTGSFTVDPLLATVGAHTVSMNNAAWVPQGVVSITFTVTVPTLTLSPDTGTGGDTIQFSGTGFSTADTTCTLTNVAPGVDPISSATCSISGGVATGSFLVKKLGNPAEIKTLRLQGNLVDSDDESFTVVPQIADTLTPGGSPANPVRVGDTVTVTGSNFAAADVGPACTIAGAGGSVVFIGCTVAADFTMSGSFSVLVTFAGATDEITVTGGGSGLTAMATLYVMPHTVIFDPISGPLGTSVSMTATGFSLLDLCPGTLLDGSLLVTGFTCSVPTGGTITGSFVAGGLQPPGAYALTLTGAPDLDVGTATFTVEPGLSVLPNSGRPGTNVLVSGTNFVSPGDTGCSISSTPSGLISSPLCTVAGGAMSGSFTVAAGSSGLYTVNVAGTTGDTGHATFNVPPPPSLTLAPNPANAGSVVTGSGTNYAGTTCLLTSSPSGLFSGSPSCSIAAGTLSASFTVASGASGSYTVTVATNAGSGDSATDSLTVSPGPTPTLDLTPTSGGAGTVVSGTGTGFTADVTCVLSAAPSTILSSASCTVTGGGGFTVGFTVSSGASVGTYAILAVGNTGKAASANFEVIPSGGRTFTLTPNSGRAGTAVTVSGENYVGTTCIGLSSSPTNIITSQTCSISAGTLTGGFTVAPGTTGGAYTVTVTTDIPADTVSAGFTVPFPTLTLAPISGAAGTSVSVSGSNYADTGTCTLTPTPSTLFTSATCSISATGALTGLFTVDSGARAGSYTVKATTSIPGDTASASFSVPAPTLVLTPNSAVAGAAVSISGQYYAGTGTCTLSSSPTVITSSPTCSISGGILDGGFIVASGATVGSYTVTVKTTISGETASATFTIPPPTGTKTLTLSPNSGRPGTTVTVSGTNYQGTSCSLSSSPSGLLSSATCSLSSGTLTGGFTVASAATAGGYTVTVTTDKETMSAAFTVPSLKPCIIATATFGSEASPAVQYLRNFRDRLVLSTRAGSAFMDVFNAWYYSFSPSVANLIASNDPLRAPIRVMLYPLLGILSVSTLAYSLFSWAPELGVVMAGLVASSLIGLVYFTAPALIGMHALLRRRRLNAKALAKTSLASLAVVLALLTIGEVTGSFLLLAIAGSAVVLICIVAMPTIVALMMARPRPQ